MKLKNGKFVYELTKVQNFPRWNDYVPKFQDNTASHSYRCAVYALIAAFIEKEKYNPDIDVEKVVCRAVYHDFNETLTGTMKHKTKKDPLVRDRIADLEKRASIKLVSYLSSDLQSTFSDFIIHAEDETLEGRLVDGIDTFDAMLFCYRETQYSSSAFFAEKYVELKEQLKNHPLATIRWLVEQVEEKTNMYKFLMSVMGMERVERWTGKFNLIEDQDAVHGFRTASLAILFGYYEKIMKNVDIDILRLVAKMLLHDLPEDYTGDVLGPVKHSDDETKKAFEEYEKETGRKMISLLPDFLQEKFRDYIVEAKSDDYEGKMVDIVDKIDALIKTSIEKRVNRFEYELTYYKQLYKIQTNYTNPCVEFFLAYILHDLDNPFMQMEI